MASAVLGVLLALSEPDFGILVSVIVVVLMIVVGWVTVGLYEAAAWGMTVVFGTAHLPEV